MKKLVILILLVFLTGINVVSAAVENKKGNSPMKEIIRTSGRTQPGNCAPENVWLEPVSDEEYNKFKPMTWFTGMKNAIKRILL